MLRWVMQIPETVSPADRRAYHLAILSGLIGFASHGVTLATFALFGVMPMVYFNIGSLVLFASVVSHVRWTGTVSTGMTLACVELTLHQVAAVFFCGWDIGFQYFLFPVASFAYMGHYRSRAVPALFTAATAAAFLWLYFQGQHLYQPHYVIPAPWSHVWLAYNVITTPVGLAIMAAIYTRSAIAMERDLREAQLMLVQSEKMAAMGKLAAGLTHEINSPIGVIISGGQTGARALEKLDDATLSDKRRERLLGALGNTLESTTVAAERLKAMVARLQSFVRVDEAEVKELDLHESIESVVALLQDQLEARLGVVRVFAEDLPEVHCRPADINQVLMHLMQNAIDAMDGEGTITVTTSHEPGWVSVAIADTGRGMSAEELEGLFDPSFVGATRVKLGMGLPVSRQIVTSHGGELRVESEVGQGSTFSVRLPLAP